MSRWVAVHPRRPGVGPAIDVRTRVKSAPSPVFPDRAQPLLCLAPSRRGNAHWHFAQDASPDHRRGDRALSATAPRGCGLRSGNRRVVARRAGHPGIGGGRARGPQAAGESRCDGTRDPARRPAPVAADATLGTREAVEPFSTWPTSLPSTRSATPSSPTCGTRTRGSWPAWTCPTARSSSSRQASSPASPTTRPGSRSICTGSR